MKVVVAMSGGVDSSVAAALMVEAGHEVIGIHLKLFSGEGHCCGVNDAMDCRRVADQLGFPLYVMNLEEAFHKAVMEDFVREYLRGATPNPCVHCNGVLKFDVLYRRAKALGAELLVTGHYARVDGGRLYAASDPGKDQSYFLFPIRPEVLAGLHFPLGTMTKPEVRAHAARLGLVTAAKPESMEVCFLPDDDHAGFIKRAHPELDGAGEIVTEDGRILGHHDAYWTFTVGQRRGLGLAGGPWFVHSVDPDTRRVVVGPEAGLFSTEVGARGFRWLRPGPHEGLLARIRHRGARVPCEVQQEDPFRLRLLAPARAVTPGQALVVYVGDEVVGGGWIDGGRSRSVAEAVRAI